MSNVNISLHWEKKTDIKELMNKAITYKHMETVVNKIKSNAIQGNTGADFKLNYSPKYLEKKVEAGQLSYLVGIDGAPHMLDDIGVRKIEKGGHVIWQIFFRTAEKEQLAKWNEDTRKFFFLNKTNEDYIAKMFLQRMQRFLTEGSEER